MKEKTEATEQEANMVVEKLETRRDDLEKTAKL